MSYYYAITSSEDGIRIKRVADIKKWIRDENNDVPPECRLTFLGEIPEIDRGYFMTDDERPVLIIKGEVVVPKPVQTVTEYEVE